MKRNEKKKKNLSCVSFCLLWRNNIKIWGAKVQAIVCGKQTAVKFLLQDAAAAAAAAAGGGVWACHEFIQTVNMRDKNLLFLPFHKPKTKKHMNHADSQGYMVFGL